MNNKNRKWLLAVVAVCCLAPAAFADHWGPPDGGKCDPRWQDCDRRHREHPSTAVPEGGSTSIYLLGAGLTCVAAMFLRSKVAKPAQS